jgi:hypothetical protein
MLAPRETACISGLRLLREARTVERGECQTIVDKDMEKARWYLRRKAKRRKSTHKDRREGYSEQAKTSLPVLYLRAIKVLKAGMLP